MAVEIANKHLAQGVGSKLIAGLVHSVLPMQLILHTEVAVELTLVLSETAEDHHSGVGMLVHGSLSPHQGIFILLPSSARNKEGKGQSEESNSFHFHSFLFVSVGRWVKMQNKLQSVDLALSC